MHRFIRFTSWLILVTLVTSALAGAWPAPRPAAAAQGQVVADNYIVLFKPGVGVGAAALNAKVNQKANAYGLRVRHSYSSVFSGFSAFVPPGQLKKLESDPDVAAVVADRRVWAVADQYPTGIRRSQADRNPVSQIGSGANPYGGVDVAVIDSGIDGAHPDLNVAGGVSCVPGDPSWSDANGHGTHVAGTIGALDNGTGVVGVAPGARLWAVRVLNAAGEGQFSDVICGVDWVTANAGLIDIANMSLGGESPASTCASDPFHLAVCRSVNAGVVYVVAAGNSALDASGFVPASFEEVITVSAIQDLDGAPGGRGGGGFFPDDTLAYFSNYGAPVDLAAPGFNIYSTWPGGGYNYASGTSMASPHVAGAAAIVRSLQPGASPAAVRSALLGIAWPQGSASGFTGDVDAIPEPLLNAGALGGDPLPPPPPGCDLNLDEGAVGDRVTVTCGNMASGETVRLYWDSTTTPQLAAFTTVDGAGTGTFAVPAAAAGTHQVIARTTSGVEIALPFVVKPAFKLSAASGKVGVNITATLSGFPASQPFQLTWDDATTPFASGTTSATGAASLYPMIPESVAGAHRVKVTTSSGGTVTASAEAPFTVVPGVSPNFSAARVGTALTVNLRGFAAGEAITVYWHDQPGERSQVAIGTASTLGSASVGFAVPEGVKGAHTIEAVGTAGSTATAAFSVIAAATVAPSAGAVGSQATLTLSGFGREEPVSVRWYDTTSTSSPLTSATTTTRGSATISFAVPSATGGSHRIDVVGTTSGTVFAFFTVNSTLTISPTTGPAGTNVTATAAGFGPGEPVNLSWFATATNATGVANATSSATGDATLTFTVPGNATTGDHKVEASGASSFRRASSTFTVPSSGPPPPVDPFCTVTPATGAVGASATVTCGNFAKSETIRVYWDDTATPYRATIWTGTTGGGSGTLVVPEAVAGEHRLIAVGATSGLRVELTFTVVPSVKPLTASGKVGSTVLAYLKGFGPNETVTVTWDGGAVVATVTVSATGAATASIRIPETTGGDHQLVATGATSALQATSTLKVDPSLTLSLTSGNVGATVDVTLRGYGAAEPVVVRWYGGAQVATIIASVTTSSSGSATARFVVPNATGGAHRVESAGERTGLAAATFNVQPRLVLSLTTAAVGTAVEISLTGFGASEQVTLHWFDTTTTSTPLATLTTNADGAAGGTVAIPDAVNGLHKVQATGAVSGASHFLYFTIKAGLALSPTTGTAGTSTAVRLTGYRAGETVKVAWFATATSSTVVASGAASATGSVSLTFAVPTGASIEGHKVEGTGQTSFARASATFTVTAAPTGGTTAPQSVTPSIDLPFGDDFSRAGGGEAPAGWSFAPGSDPAAIKVKGGGGNARLNLSAAPGGGAAWLLVDTVRYTLPDLQVRLSLVRAGSGAGVLLGWRDAANFVAVLIDAETGRLEVVEVIGGVPYSRLATPEESIVIAPGQDAWLRVESGSDAAGNWISLYWSSDGLTMRPVGAVRGLSNLSGSIGLTIGGADPPDIDVDDVIARRSQATAPVEVENAATPEQEATLESVPPTATTQPEPTATPTATSEPAPTETPPPPEPTPTTPPPPEPTPSPTPSPTPEPPPAEAPPPVEPPAEPPPDETEGDSAQPAG